METYSFGVMKYGGEERMYLRVKAEDAFRELPTGYREHREEYPDSTVTHRYCIEKCILRKEDTYFYTWYLLREYGKTVDYSPAALAEAKSAGEAAGIAFVVLAEGGTIDGVTAGEHAQLFELWAFPIQYTTGQIRRHEDGKLYRCLQDHTSQEDWTPDVSPSLWVCISDPTEEWPPWVQPVGSTDAYMMGDKTSHNGGHWTSDVDNNVWEPGVYGWTLDEEASADG